MKTSEDVRELGLYVSGCCGEELIFAENDCYSRCPRCERLCEWRFEPEIRVTCIDVDTGRRSARRVA
jgi:hypothetical protein